MANPFHENRGEYRDPRINRNGAPTLQRQVEGWYNEHPDGSISACARELGISRNTVRKWAPAPAKSRQATTVRPSKMRQIWNILKS